MIGNVDVKGGRCQREASSTQRRELSFGGEIDESRPFAPGHSRGDHVNVVQPDEIGRIGMMGGAMYARDQQRIDR